MATWTGSQLARFPPGWVADDRYGTAFYFLATTGMRRGEALGLRGGRTSTLTGQGVHPAGGYVAVETQVASMGATRVWALQGDRAGRRHRSHPAVSERKPDRAEDLVYCSAPATEMMAWFLLSHRPEMYPSTPTGSQGSLIASRSDLTMTILSRQIPRIRLHDLPPHLGDPCSLRWEEDIPRSSADRLGHTTTNITLNIYSDVVEGVQTTAAENGGGVDLRGLIESR